MSYTIGIKRRFLPGYKRVQVTGHDWQNFRFILNLADGSQIHIPGFSAGSLKVYADFWTHLAQIERTRPPQRQGAAAAPIEREPVQQEDYSETARAQPAPRAPQQTQPDPRNEEVYRRAAARVNSISGGDRSPEQVWDRPELS